MNDRRYHDYEEAGEPAAIVRPVEAQPVHPSPQDPRAPSSLSPGEETIPTQSSKTPRSSSSDRLLGRVTQGAGMRGATRAVGRASQQNAELIARLGRRFGEHQAAAKSNNALKRDGTPWKAKYEAAVADVTRLEQENWELQDSMEDALEHIEMLKRALRNSIPIRMQGEPMGAEDFEAELPFERYENEWRSWLMERKRAREQERDRARDLVVPKNDERQEKQQAGIQEA